MRIHRKPVALLVVVLLLGASYAAARPILRTVAFLMDIAGREGVIRHLLPGPRSRVRTRDVRVPTRHGSIDARVYQPFPGSSQTVVVFPGVHGGGVDEPRLATFAGRLAATGLTVVSVPLPELREFRITGRSTDMVEDAAQWVARNRSLAPRGRVSLVGVSFGGGLALAAAGRPGLATRLEGVVSLGGYGDLERVLRYLCTGVAADGTRRPPHVYGVAVLALAAAPLIVPTSQVARVEAGLRTYLDASLDETPGRRQAAQSIEEARRMAAGMDEPARSIMRDVLDHDVRAVGRRIAPYVAELAHDPALSPERSPATAVPVFLIHGDVDNIIPPSETPRVAAYLQQHGNPRVHWLLTPVLSHVGLDAHVGVGEAWKFVRFWQETRAALN